jgi:hypothetical protein
MWPEESGRNEIEGEKCGLSNERSIERVDKQNTSNGESILIFERTLVQDIIELMYYFLLLLLILFNTYNVSSLNCLEVLYIILILSKLEYSSVSWNNLTLAYSNKLENIKMTFSKFML